ncbi:hypothetical protein ATK74_1042 [Propionicimonas paludicola]|uniref:Uncharacterized protein n=1 Tax=Propionicimonas paludicola TaxID=185243 RepID=A0A2A9CSA7_9ACTN|nr:hypothetical protein ATK74_1042 [Propionicimonas paludicola]
MATRSRPGLVAPSGDAARFDVILYLKIFVVHLCFSDSVSPTAICAGSSAAQGVRSLRACRPWSPSPFDRSRGGTWMKRSRCGSLTMRAGGNGLTVMARLAATPPRVGQRLGLMSGRRRVHTKAGVHDAAFEDPRPQGHVATGRLDSATAADWLAGRATASHRAARGSGEAPVSLRHSPARTPHDTHTACWFVEAAVPGHPWGLRRHRRPWATRHQGEHKRIAAPEPPEVDRSCFCTPLPASAVSSSRSTEDPAQPSDVSSSSSTEDPAQP